MMPPLPKVINDNFYKWFGSSKVINTNNQPQICYHKSRSLDSFNEFCHYKGFKNDYNNDFGFYFVAEYNKDNISYIGNGVEFYVFLRIEKPFYFYDDNKGGFSDSDGKNYETLSVSKEFCLNLEQRGYDGIIIVAPFTYNQYIIWHGHQVKSIENNGDYSLLIKDIFN
jgi:hypothetical protein